MTCASTCAVLPALPRCPCVCAHRTARAAGNPIRRPVHETATGAARPSKPSTTIVLNPVNWPGVLVASGVFFDGAVVSKSLDIRRKEGRNPDDLEKISVCESAAEIDGFLAQRRADGRGVSAALERAAALRRAEIAAGKN